MSAYLLHDLVRVRQHREEQASEALTRALRRLQEAKAAAARARQAWEDYAAWRIQEEKRQLDGLMRRLLRLGELSDVRQAIALLREREFELLDAVAQADAAVTQAADLVDECRVRHAQAVRDLEKLLEHRQQWQAQRTREAEAAEEAELEDFSPLRPDRFSPATHDSRYERN